MDIKGKIAVMNWKCNPSSKEEAEALAVASDIDGVIICPPAPFIEAVRNKLNKAVLGSQDGFWEEGAFTGEYSFNQLSSAGVKYSVIGHSERRWLFGEDSSSISKKVKAAIKAGIIPILCVGEKERISKPEAIETVLSQLMASIKDIAENDMENIIVAYEPVWAIGTGNNASLKEVEPVILGIIEYFKENFDKKMNVIYGGSVLSENVKNYIISPYISGVLVGGSSLNKDKALEIIKIIKSTI